MHIPDLKGDKLFCYTSASGLILIYEVIDKHMKIKVQCAKIQKMIRDEVKGLQGIKDIDYENSSSRYGICGAKSGGVVESKE